MSQVELKHTYHNFNSASQLTFMHTPSAFGFKPLYPSQGVTSSQRIGLKCTSTSMLLDMALQIRSQEYPFSVMTDTTDVIKTCSGTIANGNGAIVSTSDTLTSFKPSMPWFANYRMFVVKCKPDFVFGNGTDPANPNYIEWFKKNFVYYATLEFSNQQLILRESTDDTGQFTILYDHQFKLSDRKPVYHFHNSFKIKQQFCFTNEDTDNDEPTNVAYHFFIIPPLTYFDYAYTLNATVSSGITSCNGVLKLSYTDF